MILAWLSLCDKVQRLACDPADMTAVPYFFASLKSSIDLFFGIS